MKTKKTLDSLFTGEQKVKDSVLLKFDSYDVYLLLEAMQLSLHKKIDLCSRGNVPRMFDLLERLNFAKDSMETPF